MKALVWVAPRRMEMQDAPEPSPRAGEVVIKVAYAGICGSELSGYLGHNALRVPPLVMGHEFSGVITAVGPDVPRDNPALTEGARVTVNPLLFCGECEYCRTGRTHICPRRTLVGAHRPGGFAEYVSVPANLVSPLPDSLSIQDGALTEPVAVGVRIGELAGDLHGRAALVIGAGPIGLLALQALQARGAERVFISDLEDGRLAMGEALGGVPLNTRHVDIVKTVKDANDGLGAAVAVDAVGTGVTRTQCCHATRPAGKIIFSGLHEETSSVPAADIIRRELTVQGAFSYSRANFIDALGRLERGEMRLAPWIVEAPLADGGHWFDQLIDAPGATGKVLLIP